ncbi:MAG TPA: hypothetical protein VK133_02480 [Amoebophilaceae bacterium]|nr:hypothetical protein [Amoebophilaceae bacterium]
MSLLEKKVIPLYMVLNGLSGMVPHILTISFSITLFEKDPSGISAAYLEPASLLGIGCAGLLGGFFLKRFCSYTIGTYTLLCASLTLCYILFDTELSKRSCTMVLWALACIMSIEHANSLSFINRQVGTDNKPFYFSNFQVFLQLFNVLAPIGTKNVLEKFGLKAVIVFCVCTYLVRIIPWIIIRFMNLDNQTHTTSTDGMLTGFKEIIHNSGLMRMTLFRMMNHISTIAYFVSLPILVAKMAQGNSQMNAQLYSYSISSYNTGFILSGLWGSFYLRKQPSRIIFFLKTSPILIGLSIVAAFYVSKPIYLFSTSVLYGIGLYLFRTGNSTIGLALAKKEKLAHVILAGDATVKAFACGVGILIPSWLLLPPIGGILPPFFGCVACSLFSIGMIDPIIQIYLNSLRKHRK